MWDLKQYGQNQALIDWNNKKVSYEELNELGEKLASKIGERCLVFLMCTNQMGSLLGYTAFLNNKIVPVLLNAQMDKELIFKLIITYYPAYIWAPESMTETFDRFEKKYEVENYVLLKTNYKENFPLHEELGLLLTTSGSTGSPKFVRQSYNNIRVNAAAIAEYLELDETERPVTTLPMNYTYGLSIINSHLLVGATILLTDASIMQKEFWSFMQDNEATSFGGVPYTYEMLDKLRFFKMELPSLRYMTQAGGKLSPELHKKFAEYAIEKKKKFIVMYGQCEATARMSYLPAEKSLEKYGSMGIAIPGGTFSLIDVNGKTIEEAETVGELVYEGPNVTLGYAECGKDLIKGDERNGRLVTGDMAKRDADGYYYIVGRKKRFLKVYGNRVNLDEIDTMLKSEYDQMECASSGVDDHVYIFVTSDDFIEQIPGFLATKTKLNQAAFKAIRINEIPKNDSGKVKYEDLKQYFELGET